RPEHSTILVVGDVTPDRVNALAEKYFGAWKRGNYTTKVTPEPPQTETRYVHIQVPNFPPYLGLSFKAPAFSDTSLDMPALDVLSFVYFYEKSELYKKLVLDERKVLVLSAGAPDSRDPYLFDDDASVVEAADRPYGKDGIMQTTEQAKTQPVDPQELQKTISH